MRRFTTVSGIIGQAATYCLSSGGKRWRPLFLLAVGEVMRCDAFDLRHLAAATEVLHNASLVHDDIHDRDTIRRGKETVWRRYGEETAINLGDFLITSTYLALSKITSHKAIALRLVSYFAESSHKVIAGQSAEIEASRRLDIKLDGYRQIALGKSGVLMALPVVGALMLANTHADILSNARQAMEWLGVAYQIQDDLYDLFGLKDGRPAGVDLREGRMSLPTLLFKMGAQQHDREAFETFIQSYEPHSESELRYWVERLQRSFAVEKCREEFDRTVQTALRHTSELPDPLRSVLECGKDMILTKKIREIFSQ
jgi:geranylgeranyl pyrophosphate synthase